MRIIPILSPPRLLTGAVLGAALVAADYLSFAADDFVDPPNYSLAVMAVYDAQGYFSANRSFSWQLAGDVAVTVQSVELYATGAASATATATATATPTAAVHGTGSATSSVAGAATGFPHASSTPWLPGGLLARATVGAAADKVVRQGGGSGGPGGMTGTTGATSSLLTMNSSAVTVLNMSQIATSEGMYFVAFWNSANITGQSYSRVFAVVQTAAEEAQYDNTGSVFYGNTTSYQLEVNSTTTTSVSSSSSPTSSSSSSSSSSSHDLSTGAIIGIAVACGLVSIALVIFLGVCLVCRSRRRRRRGAAAGTTAGAYGPGNRTRERIAEKEATCGGSGVGIGGDDHDHQQQQQQHHAVVVAPPAHHDCQQSREPTRSPFLDDGADNMHDQYEHHPHNVSAFDHGDNDDDADDDAAAAMMMTRHQHQEAGRGMDAYSDLTTTTTTPGSGSPTSAAGPSAGDGSPVAPEAGTRYAHLIEEGMTEEDIRRMEEEERALDAAIERAGGNGER